MRNLRIGDVVLVCDDNTTVDNSQWVLLKIWKERLDKPTTPPPHSDDMSDVSMKKPTSPPHDEGEEVPLTRMDSDDEDSEDSIVKKPLDDSSYA